MADFSTIEGDLPDGRPLDESVRIESYLPLVHSRVNAFRHCGIEPDDLFQEGIIGLLNAVRSYRPSVVHPLKPLLIPASPTAFVRLSPQRDAIFMRLVTTSGRTPNIPSLRNRKAALILRKLWPDAKRWRGGGRWFHSACLILSEEPSDFSLTGIPMKRLPSYCTIPSRR